LSGRRGEQLGNVILVTPNAAGQAQHMVANYWQVRAHRRDTAGAGAPSVLAAAAVLFIGQFVVGKIPMLDSAWRTHESRWVIARVVGVAQAVPTRQPGWRVTYRPCGAPRAITDDPP
jgi:hypothetical protein